MCSVASPALRVAGIPLPSSGLAQRRLRGPAKPHARHERTLPWWQKLPRLSRLALTAGLPAAQQVPKLRLRSGSVAGGAFAPEAAAWEDFKGVGRLRVLSYPVRRGVRCVALVKGSVGNQPVPVRIHSECLLGDVFGSERCQCGPQLQAYMRHVVGSDARPNAIALYLQGHEGKGIGFANKLRAYSLQDTEGLSEEDANLRLGFAPDLRQYSMADAALRDLGVQSVVLYTNSRRKVNGISALVAAVVPWSSAEKTWLDQDIWSKLGS